MYFEKQLNKQCTLHAFNNLLQRSAIDISDVSFVVDEIMADMLKRRKSVPTKQDLQNLRLSIFDCSGVDGISPSVVFRIGKQMDPSLYFHVVDPNDVFTKGGKIKQGGRYYITGVNKDGFNHTIAVVNKMVLDSQQNGPTPHLPSGYHIENVFLVNNVPPRKMHDVIEL